jgi:hypothetical protein
MIDFMVFKQQQTFNGRKVAAAFNIVDLFSNLFISIPVKNQTSKTVIDCLKFIFSQFNVPRKIVSDNAKALCRNPAVVHFLKINNVKQIATTTAYNSSGNKVERMHKTFRDTLKLVQETFRREKQFDMYYSVVQMMNSRPLSLSLHPHVKEICKSLGQEPGVITPFALHFGIPPVKHPLIPLENTLEPEPRGAFRAKWQHIISTYDKQLQKELEERQEQFKGRIIEEGDLVLIKNIVAHKEELRYYKEIYEVVKINKARYFCAPLFGKGAIMEVNGNNLKPYAYSEVFEDLPKDVRHLMGENLSPEELKQQAEQDPDSLPNDLQTWQQWKTPKIMALRNRITPQDRQSEPALSIQDPDSDILSETSDSSSSLFTIPDKVSEYKSEASSLLNKSGVSQLKTTPQGFVTTEYKTQSHTTVKEPAAPTVKPLIGHEQIHPNITIRRKKPTTLSNSLTDYAVTLEDIENSWKQKLDRQTRKHIHDQLVANQPPKTQQLVPDLAPSPMANAKMLDRSPEKAQKTEIARPTMADSTPLGKATNTAKLTPTPLRTEITTTPPLAENTVISPKISTPPIISIDPPTIEKGDFSTKVDTPPIITITPSTPEKGDFSPKSSTPPIITITPSTPEKPDIQDKNVLPPIIMPEFIKTQKVENSQNPRVPPPSTPTRNTIVHQDTPYTPYTPSSDTKTPTNTDTETKTPTKTDTETKTPQTPAKQTKLDSPSTLQRLFDSTIKASKNTSKVTDDDDRPSIKYRLRSRRPKPFQFLDNK